MTGPPLPFFSPFHRPCPAQKEKKEAKRADAEIAERVQQALDEEKRAKAIAAGNAKPDSSDYYYSSS